MVFFEGRVFYAVLELVLLLITISLESGLRRVVVIGLAVLVVRGLRLWLEAAYHR